MKKSQTNLAALKPETMRDDKFLDDHLVNTGPIPMFKPASTIVWGSIFLLGIFFRFMHWPGAALMLIAGLGGLTGYLLSCMMEKQSRTRLSILLATLAVGWATYSMLGLLVLDHPWLNPTSAGVYGGVILVVFIAYEGTRRAILKKSKLE